jgi:Xaa-Pro aminopeptidase
MPFSELNEKAKKMLSNGLIDLKIIKEESEIDHYYTHGVSHMLGLDTHDIFTPSPFLLEPGMVLTIEPGLYLMDKGIGVRVEDDILVTEHGAINLSEKIPKELSDVEASVGF